MLKRTLTGAVVMLILAGVIALRLVSPLFFDAFILGVSYFCLYEISMAFKAMGKSFNLPIACVIPIAAWAIFKWAAKPILWILALIMAAFILAMIFENFFSNREGENKIKSKNLLIETKTTLFVCVYPLLLISSFFGLNNLGLELGFVGIIMAFAVSIFTDVFAYCFGMMLGRRGPRLAPRISPNKSVIGAVFGIIGGILCGAIGWILFYHFAWFGGALSALSVSASVWLFTLLGVIGAVVTQLGDLVASAIKRASGLKDYSNLLPGHGGVMDRLDGQMFSGVLTLILLMLFV